MKERSTESDAAAASEKPVLQIFQPIDAIEAIKKTWEDLLLTYAIPEVEFGGTFSIKYHIVSLITVAENQEPSEDRIDLYINFHK